jgi:multiple sugar transport system substrate-binding protein
MFHSGVWEIGTLGQDQTIVYDVAPLPQGPGGRFMFHKPNSLTIPSTTQNTDAAWELLRFMRGPEAEALWIQGNGMMPFLKDSIPLFLDKGKIPNAQLFIDALEKGWGHPLPVNENGARMDQAVTDALGLALSEGRDAAWVVGDVEPKLAELVG